MWSIRSSKLAVACALSLVISLQACGGRGRAAPARDALALRNRVPTPAAPDRGPMLWTVERDGRVSHVFGTIHVGMHVAELPAVVRERFDESHTLIVEADVDPAGAPELIARMMLPPDRSLRNMLGEHDWSELKRHLGASVPDAVLDRLPPWLVQTWLSFEDPQAMTRTGSLDAELVARAREQGKPVLYLETAAQQLDLLAEVMDVDELRHTLDDVPAARAKFKALIRAYREGKRSALAELTVDPEEVAREPEQFEKLLFARNRAWMGMLVKELSRGGVFVGVGAAHYFGDQGLLELLRRQGFEVAWVPATTDRRVTGR